MDSAVVVRQDRGGFFLDEPDYRGPYGSATFSEDGRYRYDLWRRIGGNAVYMKGQVAFVCLNPSTATERANDATVWRLSRRAWNWGYEGVHVVNLFGLRSVDPKVLYRDLDPVGPENDRLLTEVCAAAALVVCAWGAHGTFQNRGDCVLELLRRSCRSELYAFGLTKNRQPRHPLFLSMATRPRPLSELMAPQPEERYDS